MEQDDTICAFDTLYTNQQIQMLKLAMPFLPSVYGSFLAIYIKFQELQYTMQVAKNIRFSVLDHPDTSTAFPDGKSLEQYFQSIIPYLSKDEKEKVQKLKTMFQTMEQFKQMKPILDMMLQNTSDSSGDNNQMDILKSFLNEEQLGLFEMFNNAL